MSNSRVFDSNPKNNDRITNLNSGGEIADKTGQSTYRSCHDTTRTQRLNWSSSCVVVITGFWRQTGPIAPLQVSGVVQPVASDPEPNQEFAPVVKTTIVTPSISSGEDNFDTFDQLFNCLAVLVL